MDDATLYLYVSIGALIVFGLAFFVGRYFDINWRCKKMRQWLKKEYIILEAVNKDGKTLLRKVVNAENDHVLIHHHSWVVSQNRVYREKDEKVGFGFGPNNMRYEEGAPVLFVDIDNIKPIYFYKEDAKVRSDEVGATYEAWIFVAISEAMSQVLQLRTLLIILVLIGLGAIAVGYLNMQTENANNLILKDMQANLNSYIQTQMQNGTLVVDTRGR